MNNTIKFAVYGDTRLEVPAGTTMEALKQSFVEIFPELKHAETVVEGDTVKFMPRAGTKGSENMKKFVYGDTKLDVPAGTSVEALKASVVEIFPELKSADFIEEGDVIRAVPRAGTKGSGDTMKFVYGDTKLDVPVGTSIDALKASVTEIFPELKSADFIQEGDVIRAVPRAGTKGSDMHFVYGDTKLDIPAGTSIDALKASVTEIFPELKSADFIQEGNVVRAVPRAGTKGN